MSRRVALSLIAPALCVLAPPRAPAQAYSSGDLIKIATEKNRELAALRGRAAEARGLLRQAGVRPAPNLEFSGAAGRPLGSPGETEYMTAYSRTLETAGKRGKRIHVAGQGVALAEAELAERTRKLAAEVRLRFLDAISAQARIVTLDRLAGTYRESLKLTEARIQQGDAAPLDAQLLLVELNRTEALKRAAAGAVQVAQADLRRLCGLGVEDPFALPAESPPLSEPSYSFSELRKRAIEQRPDLLVARLVEQQSIAETALTEAQARPDITLAARYIHRDSEVGGLYGLTAAGRPAPIRDQDNILAFGVSVPLLTKRRNQGNVEVAAARAAAARSLRQHLEAVIPLEVEAAFQQWEAARQSLGILSAQVVAQSEKNLEVIRQAYSLGQLRLLDVLNEQRRLIDTQLSRVEAETSVRRAVIDLELAVGGSLQ